jgi:hypothetical protein
VCQIILKGKVFQHQRTLIADTLYWRLARNLLGFEKCDANMIFRNFVHSQGIADERSDGITVTYPKLAHNPILRAVDLKYLPKSIPWLDDTKLNLTFN